MPNKKPKTVEEVRAVANNIRNRNYENMQALLSPLTKEEKAIFHEGRECGLVQAGFYLGLMTAAGMTPQAIPGAPA